MATCCHSFSLAVIRFHLLSSVITLCTTRSHSYQLLPFIVTRCTTRCHLLSLDLPLFFIFCHLLSLIVSLFCAFIDDQLIQINQLCITGRQFVYFCKNNMISNVSSYFTIKDQRCKPNDRVNTLNLEKIFRSSV